MTAARNARLRWLPPLVWAVSWIVVGSSLNVADEERPTAESSLLPAEGSPPPEVAREIERIRGQLGGPAVDQFPRLRAPMGEAPRGWSGFQGDIPGGRSQGSPDPNWLFQSGPEPPRAEGALGPDVLPSHERGAAARRSVEALRRMAGELDGGANRLEALELYEEADAMRDLAQQLRLKARALAGAPGSAAPPEVAPADDRQAASTRTQPDGLNPPLTSSNPESPPGHTAARRSPDGRSD